MEVNKILGDDKRNFGMIKEDRDDKRN